MGKNNKNTKSFISGENESLSLILVLSELYLIDFVSITVTEPFGGL